MVDRRHCRIDRPVCRLVCLEDPGWLLRYEPGHPDAFCSTARAKGEFARSHVCAINTGSQAVDISVSLAFRNGRPFESGSIAVIMSQGHSIPV